MFRAQSKDIQENQGYQTSGIDLAVTTERVVLLDVQVCVGRGWSTGRTGVLVEGGPAGRTGVLVEGGPAGCTNVLSKTCCCHTNHVMYVL